MGVPAAATEVVAGLAAAPGEARALLAALDPEATAAPGEWSPAKVLVHLGAVDEEIWGVRLRQLATDPHPAWSWTEPDMTGRSAGSAAQAVDAFDAGRQALLALAAGLPAEAWTRTGTHAVFGELDAAGLLREALVHDGEHLDGLRALARASRETAEPREAANA